jgi:hypothetical protein
MKPEWSGASHVGPFVTSISLAALSALLLLTYAFAYYW